MRCQTCNRETRIGSARLVPPWIRGLSSPTGFGRGRRTAWLSREMKRDFEFPPLLVLGRRLPRAPCPPRDITCQPRTPAAPEPLPQVEAWVRDGGVPRSEGQLTTPRPAATVPLGRASGPVS